MAALVAWAALASLAPAPARALSASLATSPWRLAPDDAPGSDTLRFVPASDSTTSEQPEHDEGATRNEPIYDDWRRPPLGDRILTDLEEWRTHIGPGSRTLILGDYNRVDPLRLGVNLEGGGTRRYAPRAGVRYEYAFGRQRGLYGAQVEQPIVRSGMVVLGGTIARRTDHLDLQQVEDAENSLALLLARQDYRDYFEREGGDVYAMARLEPWSIASLHWRADTWRSLPLRRSTRSWFERDRTLRDNPPIDDGRSRSLTLRLERLARRSASGRPGIYHRIEVERAGAGLGGEFTFTRALADLRAVLRLSPASTLAMRALGGSTLAGRLPAQKQFTLGGVDGLRAHRIDAFRGNQVALAQAEYTVGLWRMASEMFEGGLHAIAFVDAGRAWAGPSSRWDVGRQPMKADGGLGLSTSEDNLRVYVARDLQQSHPGVIVSLRLQRPF